MRPYGGGLGKGGDYSVEGRPWSLRSWHLVPGPIPRVAILMVDGVGDVSVDTHFHAHGLPIMEEL